VIATGDDGLVPTTSWDMPHWHNAWIGDNNSERPGELDPVADE
jgi:hypothetical protein